MNANITMRDIAEKLGISTVTVSKALNGKDGVGEELRVKVKETAAQLGYRLNTIAKSMKEGCSYNIGVVIAERYTGAGHSFYMQFYQQLVQALEEYQYSGLLHVLHAEDEASLALPRIYNERKADGFILLGQLDKAYVHAFLGTGIPVTLLDFYTDQPVDSVVGDNFFGSYEMTNYLIAEGHRDIAFVGNIYSTSSIQDRYLGYCKSLLEHKLPLRPEYVLSDRDELGRFTEITLPAPLPSAFVCNCDQVAYNLVVHLQKKGIQVPEQCSVTGFDNDLYSTLCEPKLTTMEVNMREMVETAVSMMIRKIKHNDETAGRVLVKAKPVYRNSVKPQNI